MSQEFIPSLTKGAQSYNAQMKRAILLALFALALVWAQFRESGEPDLSARLELSIDPLMPARVYLYKDGQPFRLSPIQAVMPLHVDRFYRERLWTNSPSPDTLEVTCNELSHFILLKGRGSFDLPQGHYRVEAYRGMFYTPASEEFDLRAGQTRRVALKLADWTGGASKDWISGDDHIHLTRSRQDDAVFLRWLEGEDLDVGNFLQLQRQMDAAVQYGFGPAGEARHAAYSIRPGHESRSEFYGHINLLGGREMIRPLSVGTGLSNTEEAYPFPSVLFDQGRKVGATVGYAHFNGGLHNTLLMDLAIGRIDFIEVFQFGVLKSEQWYELLNAGFQVTGVAGSCWAAARVVARKNQGEPDIQAHTNPVYLLSGGKPVRTRGARESLVKQWEEQLAWYRSTDIVFRDDIQRRDFFDRAERTLNEL